MEYQLKATKTRQVCVSEPFSGEDEYELHLLKDKTYRVTECPTPWSERYWTVHGISGFDDFDISMIAVYFGKNAAVTLKKDRETTFK